MSNPRVLRRARAPGRLLLMQISANRGELTGTNTGTSRLPLRRNSQHVRWLWNPGNGLEIRCGGVRDIGCETAQSHAKAVIMSGRAATTAPVRTASSIAMSSRGPTSGQVTGRSRRLFRNSVVSRGEIVPSKKKGVSCFQSSAGRWTLANE
jgi:hypothetical protein